MKNKPVIIFQPGPLHLFFTTGIFYFWALKDKFDFVMLVPEKYKYSDEFNKIISHSSTLRVEYISDSHSINSNIRRIKQYTEAVNRFHPRFALIHHQSYIDNQYLYYCLKTYSPEITRFYFQNGQTGLRWDEDFSAKGAVYKELLIRKYPFLGSVPHLVGLIERARVVFAFSIVYKIIPLLVAKSLFSPPVNVYSGKVYNKSVKKMSSSGKDILLSYLSREIEFQKSQGFTNIKQICHPVTQQAKGVFEYLYGNTTVSDTILILPSYGFTSQLLENGVRMEDIIDMIADKWCEAIRLLLIEFPDYAVKFKLHPASVNDPLWQSVIKMIIQKYPFVKIIDPALSAELIIFQSKVIVGDVSTALWWSGFLKNKTVISLDIFNYPAGDVMKEHPECMYYINNIENIRKISSLTLSTNVDKSNRSILSIIENHDY